MTNLKPLWLSVHDPFSFASNDVHVWCASLDELKTCLQPLARTLSDDERERARRFCFTRDRERFVAARGVLRTILGRYLGMAPEQLQLSYGPHGKPHLASGPDAGNLQFNLSHSQGLVLCAFARNRRVGVDVEFVRAMPDATQIAARFFSSNEHQVLLALPADQRQEAFFNCWTRKEAFIKAIGDGLVLPLDQFDVSLAPGKPAELLQVRGGVGETSRWFMAALQPAHGYVAGLALEGSEQADLRFFKCEGISPLRRRAPKMRREQLSEVSVPVESKIPILSELRFGNYAD